MIGKSLNFLVTKILWHKKVTFVFENFIIQRCLYNIFMFPFIFETAHKLFWHSRCETIFRLLNCKIHRPNVLYVPYNYSISYIICWILWNFGGTFVQSGRLTVKTFSETNIMKSAKAKTVPPTAASDQHAFINIW